MQPLINISFIDAAKKALLLFRMSFKSTFVYAFMVALINELLTFGLMTTFTFNGVTLDVLSPPFFVMYLFLLFLTILIGNCFILIKQNGILMKEEPCFKSALSIILARFPGIVLSGVAFTMCFMVGLALFVVPGILFMTCFYVYLPSLLFAHKRAFESWRYSFSLIRKHYLSTMGIVLLSLIIMRVLARIADLLGSTPFDGSNAYFGLEVTGMVLLTAFALLLTNAMNLVWFYLLHKNKQ